MSLCSSGDINLQVFFCRRNFGLFILFLFFLLLFWVGYIVLSVGLLWKSGRIMLLIHLVLGLIYLLFLAECFIRTSMSSFVMGLLMRPIGCWVLHDLILVFFSESMISYILFRFYICGTLNENGPHRSIGSGSIRRCDLFGVCVTLLK